MTQALDRDNNLVFPADLCDLRHRPKHTLNIPVPRDHLPLIDALAHLLLAPQMLLRSILLHLQIAGLLNGRELGPSSWRLEQVACQDRWVRLLEGELDLGEVERQALGGGGAQTAG